MPWSCGILFVSPGRAFYNLHILYFWARYFYLIVFVSVLPQYGAAPLRMVYIAFSRYMYEYT
jgi:hypothetical protein